MKLLSYNFDSGRMYIINVYKSNVFYCEIDSKRFLYAKFSFQDDILINKPCDEYIIGCSKDTFSIEQSVRSPNRIIISFTEYICANREHGIEADALNDNFMSSLCSVYFTSNLKDTVDLTRFLEQSSGAIISEYE